SSHLCYCGTINKSESIMFLEIIKTRFVSSPHVFSEKSVFVHMGGSWGKAREMEIIKSGGIHYKKADIHEVSVNIIDNTAVLLNRITLLAVVGGHEVTNPFEVTEVYVQQDGSWKLASLSFNKLLTP
ncbi:MAG: nuclear transport factor 2 family protein, partial [Anaerolineales bacterium]